MARSSFLKAGLNRELYAHTAQMQRDYSPRIIFGKRAQEMLAVVPRIRLSSTN